MTGTEVLGLALAGTAGGAINAVAGGGTLVTFPTLLFFGTDSIVANATSTLALQLGTSGSIYGFRKHFAAIRPWLNRFGLVSMIGGFIGSVLLTFTSSSTFSRLIPFLILFATVVFLLQGTFRRLAKLDEGATDDSPHRIGMAIFFQFWVAVYGGYFGAGIGILMLASLGFIGLHNIHEMNTLKTILSALINLVAAAWFIWSGLIHWPKAAVMTLGALMGYYLGAKFSQRISQNRVRQIVTMIGLTLSAVTFYKQFVR
jgi:uncharacterized membrane protein YfcA